MSKKIEICVYDEETFETLYSYFPDNSDELDRDINLVRADMPEKYGKQK